jgi:hypothetical protein
MLDLARVDLVELVMALSDQDVGEHHWLINPATGRVHVWSDDVGLDGDDSVDAEDLDQAGLRAIEPIASRDWYRLMADFADQVSDPAAQAELGIALQGRGAFRRFRDVLHQRHPDLVGPWRAYEQPAATSSRSTGYPARPGRPRRRRGLHRQPSGTVHSLTCLTGETLNKSTEPRP